MKSRVLLKILAPAMVAVGITVFIVSSLTVTKSLVAGNLFELLHFMPTWLIRFVGAMNVLTYLPIFIFGIYTLGTDGAIGKADKLRTWSIYKYLRNPMYAGVSFTILGIGLLIGISGVAAAGLLWLVVCYFVSLLEEKSLTKKFGKIYLEYKNSTPRFVPEFQFLIEDMRKKISLIGNNKRK